MRLGGEMAPREVTAERNFSLASVGGGLIGHNRRKLLAQGKGKKTAVLSQSNRGL
jgi:hypothetical protein